MPHIREILHRRTDLSTFVVHLTRASETHTALEVLADIAASHWLRAGRAFGWAKDHDDPASLPARSQRTVCFSETPLEHIHLLLGPMDPPREVVMESYGVAYPKMLARSLGINPVWYVDKTPGRDWVTAHALDAILASVLTDMALTGKSIDVYEAARLFPFFDFMGTWPSTGGRKEFWWEREWRCVGDVFVQEPGVIWLCPEDKIGDLVALSGRPIDPWIDPRWGLEAIIAHLARIPESMVSPFAGP